MGSPVTHKWCWNFYTPKKQILQFFDFTYESYIKAQEVEKRIITPVLNDEWCLNENVGGVFSLKTRSKAGKKGGTRTYELGVGLYSITTEERREIGKKGGTKTYKLGVGAFGITPEERKKINEKMYELKIGAYGRTKEQRIEDGRKGGNISGKKNYEQGIGLASISKEQRKEIVAKTNSQKWMCLETGYITTSGPLTTYQRARGIDTSKRKRIS